MQELRPHAARLGAAALLASAVATHAADPRLEEIIVTAPMHKGKPFANIMLVCHLPK